MNIEKDADPGTQDELKVEFPFDFEEYIRQSDAKAERQLKRIDDSFDECRSELKENCDYINAILDYMIATAVYYRKRGERRAKAMERIHSLES